MKDAANKWNVGNMRLLLAQADEGWTTDLQAQFWSVSPKSIRTFRTKFRKWLAVYDGQHPATDPNKPLQGWKHVHSQERALYPGR